MIMPSRRVLIAALLALLGVLAAGCGGAGSGTRGAPPAGANVVRGSVLAFVAVDSDLSSDQWQQVDKLAQKFPGRDDALAQLRQSLSKQGADYERDVKPALGPEVDVAVVSGGTSSSTGVVALTKPDDADKFKDLVPKLNRNDSPQMVYREVNGWYLLADSQEAIDRAVKGGGGSLADDATFTEAFGKLPGEALVKAYLDGSGLSTLIADAAAKSGTSFDSSSLGFDKLKYVAASASVEDEGIRFRGAARGGNLGGGNFASELMEGVPGDAFAFLDFRGEGTTDQLERLKSNPQLGPALNQLQATLGVSLEQVLALLRGEIALYARPGAGIPELTLALEEKDESGALATLDKLASRLAAMSGGRVENGSQGGHPVKTLNLGQLAIHYGALAGKLLLTSGVNGIADFGSSGEHLGDSADFKQAKDAAGMPDSTGGFLYLNLKDAIPLLEGLAGLAGQTPPAEVTENVRPLRSFLAWTEGSSGARTFDAFLEIK
jgi:hypothetical protein